MQVSIAEAGERMRRCLPLQDSGCGFCGWQVACCALRTPLCTGIHRPTILTYVRTYVLCRCRLYARLPRPLRTANPPRPVCRHRTKSRHVYTRTTTTRNIGNIVKHPLRRCGRSTIHSINRSLLGPMDAPCAHGVWPTPFLSGAFSRCTLVAPSFADTHQKTQKPKKNNTIPLFKLVLHTIIR